MFPEVFRDEVFRLETRCLWLRWPAVGDADRAAVEPADRGSEGPQKSRFDPATIAAWRSDMAKGVALHLAVVTKPDHVVAGALHLLPTGRTSAELAGGLDPCHRSQGWMTEAVQALAHAAFILADVTTITASPAVDNRDGRGVIEHCGFTYAGSGMRRSRSGRGLVPCDHFRLDLATWSSLQGWALPGFAAYSAKSVTPSTGRECTPLTL